MAGRDGNYRVGCVGAGFAASVYHLPVQQRVEGVETVAIADLNMNLARERADEFGIPDVYGSFEEMISQADLDIVSVCVPPFLHLAVTKAAAAAGVHVICEKPMAASPEEVAELVQVVEDSDIKFMIAENFWWYPDLIDAKARIDAGLIGDLFHVRVEEFINDIDPTYRRDQERFLMYEQDVHYMDVIRHLVDADVVRVHAMTRQIQTQELAGENFAMITMEFDNGVIARIDECWVSARGDQYVMRMRIDGTLGSVFINQPEHPYRIYTDKPGLEGWHYPPTDTKPPGGHTVGYSAPWPADELREGTVGCYMAFLDYLDNGIPPVTVASDNAKTMEVVFAAYESAETQQVIHL